MTCSSDISLKSNIVDAPSALDYLSKFHIRSYTINASGKTTTGVVAQELIKVLPDLVSINPDGLLSVQQPNPWVLVKGIQELTASSLLLDQLLTTDTISTEPTGALARLVHNILAYVKAVLGIGIEEHKICLDDVCMNSEQLRTILDRAGQSVPPTPTPDAARTPDVTTPTPSASPAPTPTPSDTTPATTDTPTPLPTDTPTATP